MTNLIDEEPKIEREAAHRHKRPPRSELVLALIERDGDECFYCHRDFSIRERTIDHYIPQSWAYANDWEYERVWNLENLRLACKPCNAKKGDALPNEDGTIPSRATRTFRYRRDKRAGRPELCETCDNGHNLLIGEVCANCGCDAQRYPRWAKISARECKHDGEFWCWACSIGIAEKRGATETILFGSGSQEVGLI